MPPSEKDKSSPAGQGAPPLVRAAIALKQTALGAALMAAAVLFVEYRNAGDPAFCGVGSGCFAVRVSAYSRIGPVPLPDIALPAFGILLLLSLFARTRDHHRFVAVASGLGALAALALIAIQGLILKTFCKWCVIVDTSAILAAVSAIAIAVFIGNDEGRAKQATIARPGAIAWGIASLLAVVLPFIWGKYPAIPPIPAEIAAEQVEGKVTVVAFTDFECPFCRRLHPILHEIAEQHPKKLRIVRKMRPLPGHPGAMPAAKAYVCVPEDKREAAADLLYTAPYEDLTDKKIPDLAEKLGLKDREAFETCLQAPSTQTVIKTDSELFKQLGGHGLPYTWVGGRVILGANEPRLVDSVQAALEGPRPELPVWVMFVLLGAAAFISVVITWRAQPDKEEK